MKTRVFAVLLVMSCAAGTAVLADAAFAVGAKVGTMGFGVDVTGRLNSVLSLRGTINGADIDHEYSSSDIDYDGKVKVGGYGLLLDIFPFKGEFRISGGVFKNRNTVDVEAQPTSPVTIGDNEYTPQQVGTLSGDVEFDDVVPYLGIGVGNAAGIGNKWKFLLDVGVMYQGPGDVSLQATGTGVSAADLSQEEADIEDDIEPYKVWPVIAIGVSYRF
jgi:hypothetical protein